MQTWIHGEYSHTDNSPLVHHRTEIRCLLLLNILYFSVFSFSTHINTGVQYWEQTGLDKAHPWSDSGAHCASEGGAEGAHPHPQTLRSQTQGSQIQPQASETSLFLLEYSYYFVIFTLQLVAGFVFLSIFLVCGTLLEIGVNFLCVFMCTGMERIWTVRVMAAVSQTPSHWHPGPHRTHWTATRWGYTSCLWEGHLNLSELLMLVSVKLLMKMFAALF